MTDRRGRIGRALFCTAWLVALGLAFQAGATAIEVGPEHLIGLLGCGYLAAWGPYFLLSERRAAGRAARFVAASGSIGGVLLMFEGPAIARLVDYRAVFSTPTPPWRRPGNRPDPDLIFARRGHRHDRLRFAGADVRGLEGASGSVYRRDLKLDRDGFRNPVDLDRADVVILGDSFVEGLQVEAGELVSARLAERLGRPVANLGRTGYGPEQELHVLRRFGLPLRPRACVWAFYEGNDLQDVANYDADRARAARARPESLARDWYSRSLNRNGLAYLAREWLRPEPTTPARLRAGRFVDVTGREIPIYFSCGVHEGASLPITPRGKSPELARFRSILAEARDACDRAGVDLIVTFVPAKFRVLRDLCAFDPDSPCRDWPIDNLPEALRDAVADVSPAIGFLDLAPRFHYDARAGRLPYLADDTHWSPEGHRSAALALGDFLELRFHPPKQTNGNLRSTSTPERCEKTRGEPGPTELTLHGKYPVNDRLRGR